MIKPTLPAIGALAAVTSAFAALWAYTSQKYDCFNIGPCVGDLDWWITLGDVAVYFYMLSWGALPACAGVYGWHAPGRGLVAKAGVGMLCLLVPPALLFGASAWFNRGITVAY